MKRVLAVLFLSLLVASLYVYPLLRGGSMSESEDLTAFPALSLSGLLDGSFQDTFETALKDQSILRGSAVKAVVGTGGELKSIYSRAQDLLRRWNGHTLTPWGAVYRMDHSDWLTNMPYRRDEQTVENYLRKAEEINRFTQRNPGVKVYVYYCSRAEDLDWFDQSEGIESFSYADLLKDSLDDGVRFDRMKFTSFAEYTRLMYKSDHHWNYFGARKGYTDLLRMLEEDFPMGRACPILRTQDFGGLLWCGSRAREAGTDIPEAVMDSFVVDRYELGEYRAWFGDSEQETGLESAYDAGQINRDPDFDQYLNYYGFESQPIRLEFPGGEQNLLIVGDSFARAVRKPLASHFGTTIFVNFRILNQVDLQGLVERNGIDAVLFMGQQDAWSGYFLEDAQGETP